MVICKSLTDPQLLSLLQNGSIGVIPTDTQYGVVALASNKQAVERLYALKKREHKPGTVIAANIEQLVELGIKARYLKAVEQFWPNAISIVLPVDLELSYLHQGKMTLAVRIPKNKELINLLQETGPLLTSSANQPGKLPAKNIGEAQRYFDDQVDFYVDGGELAGKPSTVIRIVDDAVEVLREGAVEVTEWGNIKTKSED